MNQPLLSANVVLYPAGRLSTHGVGQAMPLVDGNTARIAVIHARRSIVQNGLLAAIRCDCSRNQRKIG